MPWSLVLLLSFLLGAVPFALLVVRALKGVDVRTVGSGNVGATNASRVFTSRRGRVLAFVLIYLLDAAKGFAPAWYAPGLVPAAAPLRLAVFSGAAAVLGHVFSPFLRFRGGKGVATATGVLLALDWLSTVVAIGVFFIVRAATGKVFFGSLALGLSLPAAAILLHLETAFGDRMPVTVLCCLIAALLFWTHRSNLRQHFTKRGDQP